MHERLAPAQTVPRVQDLQEGLNQKRNAWNEEASSITQTEVLVQGNQVQPKHRT